MQGSYTIGAVREKISKLGIKFDITTSQALVVLDEVYAVVYLSTSVPIPMCDHSHMAYSKNGAGAIRHVIPIQPSRHITNYQKRRRYFAFACCLSSRSAHLQPW